MNKGVYIFPNKYSRVLAEHLPLRGFCSHCVWKELREAKRLKIQKQHHETVEMKLRLNIVGDFGSRSQICHVSRTVHIIFVCFLQGKTSRKAIPP